MPAVNINCPLEQLISATGTGSLQIQTTGTYSYGESPDITFNIDVDPVTFADNFISIANTADNLQNPVFTLLPAAKATLKKAVKEGIASDFSNITGNDYAPFNAQNATLEKYVANWAQNSIKASLATDNLAAFLSAEEIKDLALTNFESTCDAAVDALWLSLADKLPQVVFQYNNGVWMREPGDSVDPTVIPLQVDDSMTFRFNVSATFTITPDNLLAPTGLTTNPAVSTLSYSLTGGPKKVNVVLNFKSGGAQTLRA